MARKRCSVGYNQYRVGKLESGLVGVEEEDNSGVEVGKDDVVEVRPCRHLDNVNVLDSTAVASGHFVEQGGGSCVNAVRRLTACCRPAQRPVSSRFPNSCGIRWLQNIVQKL